METFPHLGCRGRINRSEPDRHERRCTMSDDAGDVYRRVTEAFSSGDGATLQQLIADDVVWHTDDLQATVPSTFHGREEFFAAAATPSEQVDSWEIIPVAVLSDGRTAFSHQIDRFRLKDGSQVEIHFLLHIAINDRGQIAEVWEFGQSALPH
jgi:ketosteroid isomerase-like protein